MTATALEILRLRRMVAEPDVTNGYTDTVLADAIERYPLIDADGLDSTDEDWTATYDINAAAAELWEEKSATAAADFDFDADGASFKRSQKQQQAMRMARYYGARRAPGSFTLERDTNDDDLDVEDA